jgi:Tol biopolymer transport system component
MMDRRPRLLLRWLGLALAAVLAGGVLGACQADPPSPGELPLSADPAPVKAPPFLQSPNPEAPPILSPTPPAPPTLPPTRTPHLPGTRRPPPSPEVDAIPGLPPTPLPEARLRQLTWGGCCSRPVWSPDSQALLFVDRPDPSRPWGWYRVPISGQAPEYFAPVEGVYSPDQSLLAFPARGQTVIERPSDGQMWVVPAGGREVFFSRDSRQVAWNRPAAGSRALNTALWEVWVSQVDGGRPQLAASVYGGGFAGWFPDGRLLVGGRASAADGQTHYWAVSPEDGQRQLLASGFRLRSGLVSPQGEWLAYQSVFAEDMLENGIWLVHTRTLERRRLEAYGAYRWAGEDRLLLVPAGRVGVSQLQTAHRLLEYRPSQGRLVPLTNPETLPFRVANGDWSVSPDGQRIAFISADDDNIWLLEFE